MIETFVRQRITDPDDWFVRVPQYQRSGTDPSEKRRYLDQICAVIDRIDTGPLPLAALDSTFPATPSSPLEAESRKTSLDSNTFSVHRDASLLENTARPYGSTDFAASGLQPHREAFYDPYYVPTLRKMVSRVIEKEGLLPAKTHHAPPSRVLASRRRRLRQARI
jgi:hypothetical protein